ncbi:CoA-binding protein [Helicobacter sp. T3_23-1056]
MNDIKKKQILENAKNIAILGLSPDESKASNIVARYLLAQGYNVIPIYPRLPSSGEILGCRAYASLQEAFSDFTLRDSVGQGGAIDILNVFRKSEALESVANEIIALKHKPKCVWVQLDLYNEKAKAILQNAGIAYEEDSCIKLEHRRLFG